MTAELEGLTGRDKLIGAATQLFVRDGYKATSMKAIASHVGMSKPALYWHFPTKQELYLTVLSGLLDDLVGYVGERVTAADPVERLGEFVTAHITWHLEERDAVSALAPAMWSHDLLDDVPDGHGALLAKQRDHLGFLSDILSTGREAGVFRDDSSVTAFAIITMCDYVSSWYSPEGKVGMERVVEIYRECVLRMLDPSFVSAQSRHP